MNGTLEGTDDTGTSAYIRTSSPNYLGRDYSGRYFDGTLDHVQIWQEDLTASEIRAIHDNPLSGPRIYSTEHYGVSDGKTNSDGKLDDIFVVTKIYDGSSSGANVDTLSLIHI